MFDPWMYVTNEKLMKIYQTAVELNLGKDNIKTVFAEIQSRNLRIDKPSHRHLKRLK